MEISKDMLSKMDNHELLEIVMTSVNDIFNNYSYLKLDKDSKEKIVENAINKTKVNYDINISYTKYLKIIIKQLLERYIKIQFNNSEKTLKLLNNYLLSLPKVNNIYDVLDNLNKLELFLIKYDYQLNKDIIINLLSQSEQFTIYLNYLIKEKNYNRTVFIKQIIDTWYENINKDLYSNYEGHNDISSYAEYMYDITKIPLLSFDEEKRLFKEFQNGNLEARKKIIEGNLRLVISIANNYRNCSIPMEDLIQEGNIGLMEAVNHYNEYDNCKFSTFAYICIKRCIIRAIRNKGRMIRLPDYCYDKLLILNSVKNKLKQELGREATIYEIAKYLNMPIDTLRALYFSQYELTSINEKINDEEDEIEIFIESHDLGPEEIVIQNDFNDSIKKLFEKANLSEKEIDIIKSRYGFNNNKVFTLDELGKKYGITRERVRQLEARAINKMRLSAIENGYRCFISESDEYKVKGK